jgi:hypothetical protein
VDLAEAAGCRVLERVEELSVWRDLGVLARVVGGVREAAGRAVARGLVAREEAERWLDEQHQRDAAGEFSPTIPKMLAVAAEG